MEPVQVEQFYLGCLAHASYMVGSEGVAAIIDPQRDVDIYLEAAARKAWKIEYIIETHVHADFVSGHRELAERTGAHCLTQESLGGVHVALAAQVEIDCLTNLVDCSIEVHPLALDPDIGLVHAPRSADRAGEPLPALFELRSVMLDPPQNGRVSHADAPLSHHGHQVSKTQLKAQIPTNTQDYDFLVEVPTFEQFLDWYESRHLSIIPDSWSVLHQSLFGEDVRQSATPATRLF